MSELLVDEQGRPEPPAVADESATLRGFLGFLRATLLWKVQGLDDEQIHARPLPSSMSLGGLLKHLAWVEDLWFGRVLAGEPTAARWREIDWKINPDWEWESSDEDTAQQLLDVWQEAVTSSNEHWQGLARDPNFTLATLVRRPRGDEVSVRWVLTHMVEEYARHCGHADLLREALDGATGE